MYCKECGKDIDNDSKFCSYCGTKQSMIQISEGQKKLASKPESTTHRVNVPLLLKEPNKQEKNYAELDKYDKSYKGDKNVVIVAIVVLILTSIIGVISKASTDNSFFVLYWASTIIWWLVSIIWIGYIAKKQNRNSRAWETFAFFLPYIAIIIIGCLKKLNNHSVDSLKSDSNFQTFGVKVSNNSKLAPLLDNFVLDSLKYSIIKSDVKRSLFKSFDEYTIEFFDSERGAIYSFNSLQFFIMHTDDSAYYYTNMESAIKALYLYLTKKETLKDDLAFSR